MAHHCAIAWVCMVRTTAVQWPYCFCKCTKKTVLQLSIYSNGQNKVLIVERLYSGD